MNTKLAVKGKGLGTPGSQQTQIQVGQRQTSKGNSKQVPLPASSDVSYLRGGKKK